MCPFQELLPSLQIPELLLLLLLLPAGLKPIESPMVGW